MLKTLLLFPLVVLLASGAEDPDPVRALRYRIRVVDSALELTHGGDRWTEELYFPDRGVVANVTSEVVADGDSITQRWRMNAFASPIRNRFAETVGGEEVEHATEEVQVPRALAEKIFELADLTRKLEQLAGETARKARKSGLFGRK